MCVTRQIDVSTWTGEAASRCSHVTCARGTKLTSWGLSFIVQWLCLFALVAATPVVGQAQDDNGRAVSSEKAGLKLPPRHGGNESHAEPRHKGNSAAGGLWTTVISLVAIVGSLLLVGHLLRPYLGAPRTLSIDALEMLGRRAIDSKVAIHLVRCGGRVLVLSVSPEGARTLSEITDPDEVRRLIDACSHTTGMDRQSAGLPARSGKVSLSAPSEGQRRAA